MLVKVFPTAQNVCEVRGDIAMVIDVLRATSVITTALHNGAEKIIVASTIEEAWEKARILKNNVILGGERNAIKVPGFDVGNSPLEYTRQLVEQKAIIITTSNGTLAIKNSEKARHIVITCFLNVRAACKKALQLAQEEGNADIAIVCAGTLGHFSLDDAACAGMVVENLMESYRDVELSDLAFVCRELYRINQKDIKGLITHAMHYNKLLDLGFEKDIEYCLNQNVMDCVPIYDKADGSIHR